MTNSILYSYRARLQLHSFPTRRSSDLIDRFIIVSTSSRDRQSRGLGWARNFSRNALIPPARSRTRIMVGTGLWYSHSYRSEEHTSELQSQSNLVCRLLLEKKNKD